MQFRVSGTDFRLTREDVINALRDQKPPKITRKYFIRVERRDWPVRQAVHQATGLPLNTFPTAEAVRVLSRLGFTINTKKEKEKMTKPKPPAGGCPACGRPVRTYKADLAGWYCYACADTMRTEGARR